MLKKFRKSVLAVAACLLAAVFLVSCGGKSGGYKDIVILVPNADHGWTGAVLQYAQEKAKEINDAGKYTAEVITSESVQAQSNQIDDIIASSKKPKGIVILPQDNNVETKIVALANSGIPFVMFDRIVSDAQGIIQSKVISNVKGDNEGIGYETAKRFVRKDGLRPGEPVYIFIGDNSSVPESRTAGFKKYLKEAGWTQAQLDKIPTSDSTGWARAKGKTLFIDWMGKQTAQTMPRFIFTHDDELAMGILEALKSSDLTDNQKKIFADKIVALGASSGLNEIYSVLKDNHKTIERPKYDLFSVTYDPAMIQISIQSMVDHLNGASVKKENVIPVSVVDATNVENFKGFGDAISK